MFVIWELQKEEHFFLARHSTPYYVKKPNIHTDACLLGTTKRTIYPPCLSLHALLILKTTTNSICSDSKTSKNDFPSSPPPTPPHLTTLKANKNQRMFVPQKPQFLDPIAESEFIRFSSGLHRNYNKCLYTSNSYSFLSTDVLGMRLLHPKNPWKETNPDSIHNSCPTLFFRKKKETTRPKVHGSVLCCAVLCWPNNLWSNFVMRSSIAANLPTGSILRMISM